MNAYVVLLGLALLALALVSGCIGNQQGAVQPAAVQGGNVLGISDSDLGVDNLSMENDTDFTDVSVG